MPRIAKGLTLIELLIVIFIAVFVGGGVIAMFFGDNNGSNAIEAAEAQGFKDAQIISVHRWYSAYWHGCGDDWKATVINATNPIGKRTTITVCEGFWLKGSTIRH